MSEIRVSSWNELNERLYEESWDEDIQRFRPSLAYRGMGDAAHDLTSSLGRLGDRCADVERPMLRNFRKYAHLDAVQSDSEWDWLAVGQHHGLPTRLMDWTHSPYVALHFATHRVDAFDRDGIVWCVNYVQAHELLPDPLRKLLADERSDLFTTEMLTRAAASMRDFDALADDPFVVFFEPPSLDERIVNQYGLFSLMPDPDARIDQWLAAHPELVRRIVVPAELKWELRDKLDQANVTERVLFPGLDGLATWLKRYYSPREARRPPDARALDE